jgi:Tropinone reductase 1
LTHASICASRVPLIDRIVIVHIANPRSRAIVEELASLGATVHTCARTEAPLNRCREELTAKGLAVTVSVCDVSLRADREALAGTVRELFGGKLSILVN